MPILDGAPGFILLGFILALAAYLRQVSTAGQKLTDELEGGGATAFPYYLAAPEIRKEKIDLLVATRSKLAYVTQALFVMLFFLALRMVGYAMARMGWVQLSPAETARDLFDFLFVVVLLGLVVAMWIMHTTSRGKDDEIRKRAVASQVSSKKGERP